MTNASIQVEQNDNPPSEAIFSSFGPGTLLKQMREHKKLNKEEVVKKLRWRLYYLEEIEQNNFSRGTAPVYMRGYLRAYAKLLDIDPKPILQAYEDLKLPERKIEKPFFITPKKADELSKSESARSIARWLSLVIILLLFAMVVMWWKGQKKHLQPALQAPAPMQNTAAPANPPANTGTQASPPQSTPTTTTTVADPFGNEPAVSKDTLNTGETK